MSDVQEIHIACSQCNYSNAALIPIAKYKEIVYQPCNDNEDEQDHNKIDRITGENCRNNFDFYWCLGHSVTKNDINTTNEL